MRSQLLIWEVPSKINPKILEQTARFPNKPLAKINNVPMIIHVLNKAKESKVGEVFVATPDDEIFHIVNEMGIYFLYP